ncbi:MAG: cation:proton antiporter [Candidatus Aquicultor sp.]
MIITAALVFFIIENWMPDNVSQVLINLFVLFTVAKIAAEVFTRLKLPEVVGELLAGIVIGPSVLGLVSHSSINNAIATLGIMVLLFAVGLETSILDLRRVGFMATNTAILGIVFPFILVLGLLQLLNFSIVSTLFIAAATVATSVGITARVLSDLGATKRIEAKIILGAAVVDDIIGLLILAVIVAYAQTHTFSALDFLLVLLQMIAFIAFTILIAPRFARSQTSLSQNLRIHDGALIIAIVIMLGLSAIASFIGLAAIVGAFFAGMTFAETKDKDEIAGKIHAIFEFLTPFFFIVTGTLVDVGVFLDPAVLGVGLLVTILAIVGKVLGGLIATRRLGFRTAIVIGAGMVPRGEVGFIIASIGLSLGAVTQPDLSIIILMSLATTIIVPPFLPILIKRNNSEPASKTNKS